MVGADVGVMVVPGEGDGAGGDVDTEEGEGGDVWGEETMEEESYAAGAGAEVEDPEGSSGGGRGRGWSAEMLKEDLGEVGGVSFCLGTVAEVRYLRVVVSGWVSEVNSTVGLEHRVGILL